MKSWQDWAKEIFKPEDLVKYYLNQYFPIDVIALCYSLNISIVYKANSNFILIKGDNVSINLDEKTPIKVKRYLIAHMMGHILLHSDGEKFANGSSVWKEESFVSDSCEIEANRFALDLLMPEKQISRLIIEPYFDVAFMSKMFDVAEEIATLRYQELSN